jgi:hypothetical protein
MSFANGEIENTVKPPPTAPSAKEARVVANGRSMNFIAMASAKQSNVSREVSF